MSQFLSGSETDNIGKMYHTCSLCLYTLGSWSSCENCTTVDDYNEKCRLCNPCKLHKGYAVQIKDCNTCLEETCDSHPNGYLCSNCHFDKCDQWENTYPGMIGKNPKRDFSLFLRDWYRRGFKLYWEEEFGARFNCKNMKRVWFLRHRCEDNASNDYKPSDFYLAVTESDSSYENIVCDITSNNQIETGEFFNMNRNSIIDFTRRFNKNEVTIYCGKCDPDFARQDQYKLNPNDLPPLIVVDDDDYDDDDNLNDYEEEEI